MNVNDLNNFELASLAEQVLMALKARGLLNPSYHKLANGLAYNAVLNAGREAAHGTASAERASQSN